MLGWPGNALKILSIGTINDPRGLPSLRGKLPMIACLSRLFMVGQAHSAPSTFLHPLTAFNSILEEPALWANVSCKRMGDFAGKRSVQW
jgi:hypothetical protein